MDNDEMNIPFIMTGYVAPKEKLLSKIKLKSLLFRYGSIEFLGTGDKPFLARNCLNVALLYLKLIEVNYLSSEKQISELERIIIELDQLINQHPRVKQVVEDTEKNERGKAQLLEDEDDY
jgi:hypothetical protein